MFENVRTAYRIVGVRLIRFQFTMVAELNVDCSATELGHARGIIIYHRRCSIFIRHFQERLQHKMERGHGQKSKLENGQ